MNKYELLVEIKESLKRLTADVEAFKRSVDALIRETMQKKAT